MILRTVRDRTGSMGAQISREHRQHLSTLRVEDHGPHFQAYKSSGFGWYVADGQGVCVLDDWFGIAMDMPTALFIAEALNTRIAVAPVMGGSRDLPDPRTGIDEYYYDRNYRRRRV